MILLKTTEDVHFIYSLKSRFNVLIFFFLLKNTFNVVWMLHFQEVGAKDYVLDFQQFNKFYNILVFENQKTVSFNSFFF